MLARSKNATAEIVIGARFGAWTVISVPSPRSCAVRTVTCRCACGIVREVFAPDLVRGRSGSCKACAYEALRQRAAERRAQSSRPQSRPIDRAIAELAATRLR